MVEDYTGTMRILICSAFYPPHVGGCEKNVAELAKSLVAVGHEVDVLTSNTNQAPRFEVSQGVHVYRLPSIGLLKGLYPVPVMTLPVVRHLFSTRYAIVCTQTRFFIVSALGAAYAAMKRVPLIHTERGTRHTATTSPVVDRLSRIYDHLIGGWIMSRAVKVVGVSDAACVFAEHLGAKSTTRIANGIHPHQHHNKTVAFVGRLIEAKGVHDFVAAAEIVRKSHPDLHVVIAGDGPYRKHLPNHSYVTYLGEIDSWRVGHVLAGARLLVNPSYSEGLPTAVMEAMADGVPVVATDVGGTRELIEDHKTGLLVAPKDIAGMAKAILWVLDHEYEAHVMADLGREHVLNNYSWESVTRRYCTLLENTCGLTSA